MPVPLVAVDVQVEAAPGCVTADTFRAALAAHGVALAAPAVGPAAPGAGAPVLRVHVEDTAAGVVGTLRLERGDVVERQVRGASCADVEEALALVAALALDDEPASPAPAVASPPRSADAETTDDLPPPTSVTHGGRVDHDHALGMGAQGTFLGLNAPAVRPGVAVFGELLGELGGARRSARATFAYAWASVAVAPSALELTWVTGRLDGCPFDFAVGAGFEVTPCVAWEIGVLHESARNALNAPSSTRPWLGPGAVVRVAFRLAPFLRLELQAAAIVPLERDEYVFAPAGIFGYRPPPVVPSGAGGLGFDFL